MPPAVGVWWWVGEVSALCVIPCFDTVGLVAGRTSVKQLLFQDDVGCPHCIHLIHSAVFCDCQNLL